MFNLQLTQLFVLFTLTIFPQVEDRLEQGWLFKLSSSSDIVVTGTIIESRGIRRRLSAEELSTLDDLSKMLGGTLFSLRVESVIGAKSDFKPGQSRPKLRGQVLHIFVDRNSKVYRREFYQEKQSYLVFLKVLPEQTNLTKLFELSEGTIYYGATDGGEGPIQISGRMKTRDSSILSNIRTFLRALDPVSKEGKLKLLEPLANSPDEELRQSTKSAIKLIEANARQ